MGLGPTPSSSPLPTLLAVSVQEKVTDATGNPRGECSGTVSCLPGSGDRSSQMLSCNLVARLVLQLQSRQ